VRALAYLAYRVTAKSPTIALSKAVMAAQQIPRSLLQIRLSCSLGTIYVPEWRDIDHCMDVTASRHSFGVLEQGKQPLCHTIKRKYIFVFQ
jgi:hypothetical protein